MLIRLNNIYTVVFEMGKIVLDAGKKKNPVRLSINVCH